jgi:hypothetical protein
MTQMVEARQVEALQQQLPVELFQVLPPHPELVTHLVVGLLHQAAELRSQPAQLIPEVQISLSMHSGALTH